MQLTAVMYTELYPAISSEFRIGMNFCDKICKKNQWNSGRFIPSGAMSYFLRT